MTKKPRQFDWLYVLIALWLGLLVISRISEESAYSSIASLIAFLLSVGIVCVGVIRLLRKHGSTANKTRIAANSEVKNG